MQGLGSAVEEGRRLAVWEENGEKCEDWKTRLVRVGDRVDTDVISLRLDKRRLAPKQEGVRRPDVGGSLSW